MSNNWHVKLWFGFGSDSTNRIEINSVQSLLQFEEEGEEEEGENHLHACIAYNKMPIMYACVRVILNEKIIAACVELTKDSEYKWIVVVNSVCVRNEK